MNYIAVDGPKPHKGIRVRNRIYIPALLLRVIEAEHKRTDLLSNLRHRKRRTSASAGGQSF